MDKLENYIKILSTKMKVYFDGDATGHSIDHLERTMKYALKLQEKEGGDRVVVGIAAYIHDVHRIMGTQQGRYVSPKESLPVVENFLKDLNLSSKRINHILHAVEHHEEYSFGQEKVAVDDIESKIVQDADNLDAIGAVGLVRTIKYCIAHNIPIYDPNIPLYRNEYSESIGDKSSIHHIYNKLIRLGKNMNTKTAKDIAKQKTKLLKDFVKMYIDEVS